MRNKRDLRLTYFLIYYSLTFSSSSRCLFFKLKASNQIHFFTLDFPYICDEQVSFHFSHLCKFYTIWKFERINIKSFYPILLILSDEIDLNPRPVYKSQSYYSNERILFKAKGIHLTHLNLDTLLPKIDDIRYIVKRTNGTVIGISKPKLYETVLQSEIQISSYELLKCDRNRNGRGIACCIRSDIG